MCSLSDQKCTVCFGFPRANKSKWKSIYEVNLSVPVPLIKSSGTNANNASKSVESPEQQQQLQKQEQQKNKRSMKLVSFPGLLLFSYLKYVVMTEKCGSNC